MKMACKSILGVALAISAGVAMASDYRFEAGASVVDFDSNTGWGIDGTLYFLPVRAGEGPLAEAPFLSRSGSIGLGYSRDSDGNFEIIDGAVDFWAGDFYMGVGGSRFSNGIEVDSYGVRAGWMVARNTLVTGGYDRIDATFNHFFGRFTSRADIWSAGVKHVELLGGGRAINFAGEIGIVDDNDAGSSSDWAYYLEADYYPMPTFGFGARTSGIGSDNEWGLGARWFFVPRASIGVEWSRIDDENLLQGRLAARF